MLRKRRLTLDHPAIDLLFKVIELPGARISGAAMEDHFGAAAQLLKSANLLLAGWAFVRPRRSRRP